MIYKQSSAALRAGLGEQLSQSGTPAEAFPILDGMAKGIDFLGRKSINALMTPGRDPETAALLGLGLGGSYDIYKRLTNSKRENDEEGLMTRGMRYGIPAAALGLLGKFTGDAFSNYYNSYPHYKA